MVQPHLDLLYKCLCLLGSFNILYIFLYKRQSFTLQSCFLHFFTCIIIKITFIDSISEFPEQEGYRHYCIFDELYSGTNPKEATKSAYAFLKYMSKYSHVDFILTTHYTSVCSKLKKSEKVANFKMDVKKKGGKLLYTYKMKKGISKIHGAINILENMNYPKEILENVKQDN